MTTFHKTTWDNVKVGDTVLMAASGAIWEVVIEDYLIDGLFVVVAYHYCHGYGGRRYRGARFKALNAEYVALNPREEVRGEGEE